MTDADKLKQAVIELCESMRPEGISDRDFKQRVIEMCMDVIIFHNSPNLMKFIERREGSKPNDYKANFDRIFKEGEE